MTFPKTFESMYMDSFATGDPYRAAMMVYLGLTLYRCVVLQDESVWCEFDVPRFDQEAYDQEWDSTEPISLADLKSYIIAIKTVFARKIEAKRNGGEWVDRQYVRGDR